MPSLIGFELHLMLRVCSATSRDTQHFYWAPHKKVPVAFEEVDELAFLFRIQVGTDLHGFSWVLGIDLHGLGILVCLENAGCRGISRLSGTMGNWRLSSLGSAVVTVVVASSMLLCSQSSARCILASKVMIPAGPGVSRLR
jgi:hypothetical protein